VPHLHLISICGFLHGRNTPSCTEMFVRNHQRRQIMQYHSARACQSSTLLRLPSQLCLRHHASSKPPSRLQICCSERPESDVHFVSGQGTRVCTCNFRRGAAAAAPPGPAAWPAPAPRRGAPPGAPAPPPAAAPQPSPPRNGRQSGRLSASEYSPALVGGGRSCPRAARSMFTASARVSFIRSPVTVWGTTHIGRPSPCVASTIRAIQRI
jgi:hypothetical protein